MDKKSFLRGFGTGVLFASAILGISFSIRTSESATISNAKKLGMVFESNNQKVIVKETDKPDETSKPDESESPASQTPDSTKAPDSTETPKSSQTPKATKAPESKASKEPASTGSAQNTQNPFATKLPAATKKPSDKDISKQFEDEKNKLKKNIEDEKKQLTINDGDWAGKVSERLEDMGIIDDAAAFDKYLVDNGYSNIIHSGTYDVSPDDTYSDLAKKITLHSR